MAAPWQPVRRHLCLSARCPRPPPGTERSVRGEPARAPQPGGCRESPGRHRLPPQHSRGVVGCRWTLQQLGEHWHRDTPNAGRVLESKGAPSPEIGADTGTPSTRPRTGMAGLGPGGIPAWGQGGPGRGIRAPHGHPPRGARQRIPGSDSGCSRRARKRPLDFITHFLPWLPGDKRLEETGFHFPWPQQGAQAPPREPLAPRLPAGTGDAWRQGRLSPTRAASSPGRIRPLARGRNNFGTALARGQLSGAGSETRSFIAVGPPALATGRFGVRPYRGQGLGGQSHRAAHGSVPGAGAAGTGSAGDGNGLAQARLWLAARRPHGSPSPARIRLPWVLALGCCGVHEGVPHHPAIYRVTSAAGSDRRVPRLCQQPPLRGAKAVGGAGGGGDTRGAPERHWGGHAGVPGLCLGCIGAFQGAKKGCTKGVMRFIQAFHWGHIRGFLGGRRGTQWGCAERGAERNNQGDPGGTQERAKGSRCGA